MVRRQLMGFSQVFTLFSILFLIFGPARVVAQSGAVEALGQTAGVSAGKPVSGAAQPWTSYVIQPKVAGTQTPKIAQPQSGTVDSLFLGLGALFLVVLAGAGGYFMAKSRQGDEIARQISEIQIPAPILPPAPQTQGGMAIELRGAEIIEGIGSLLILEMEGEFMAVFVSGESGAATMLCRLSEPPSLGWRLDEVAAAVVEAVRLGSPQEAAVLMAQAIPRAASGEGSSSVPGQDEDLDVLLDELLGKVGGLRPAAKG